MTLTRCLPAVQGCDELLERVTEAHKAPGDALESYEVHQLFRLPAEVKATLKAQREAEVRGCLAAVVSLRGSDLPIWRLLCCCYCCCAG